MGLLDRLTKRRVGGQVIVGKLVVQYVQLGCFSTHAITLGPNQITKGYNLVYSFV